MRGMKDEPRLEQVSKRTYRIRPSRTGTSSTLPGRRFAVQPPAPPAKLSALSRFATGPQRGGDCA
jgi:hypothetical protein